MPDDPLDRGSQPEEELRRLFDEIEDDESKPRPSDPRGPDEAPVYSELRGDADAARLDQLHQIEDSLDTSSAEWKESVEKIDDEFELRAQQLRDRLDAAKKTRETQDAARRKGHASDAQISRGTGFGLSIAYTIMGMPMLGALIGWFIDQRLGTRMWIGTLTLVGAVVGVVAVVAMLQRSGHDS